MVFFCILMKIVSSDCVWNWSSWKLMRIGWVVVNSSIWSEKICLEGVLEAHIVPARAAGIVFSLDTCRTSGPVAFLFFFVGLYCWGQESYCDTKQAILSFFLYQLFFLGASSLYMDRKSLRKSLDIHFIVLLWGGCFTGAFERHAPGRLYFRPHYLYVIFF